MFFFHIHTIALGNIHCYLSSSLHLPKKHGEPSSAEIAQKLNSPSSWEKQYHTKPTDINRQTSSWEKYYPRFAFVNLTANFLIFAHTILDLLIQYTPKSVCQHFSKHTVTFPKSSLGFTIVVLPINLTSSSGSKSL